MPTLGTYDFSQLNYRDTVWTKQPRGTSPWERFSGVLLNNPANATLLYDDFFCNNASKTLDTWQIVKGTGGTITIGGPAATNTNGWLSVPTAAALANDYQCFFTQAKQYALVAGSPILYEAYINVTEANVNTSSWFVGFTDTTTTGFLQNSGAPAASFSGAVFWKATGALQAKFMTSNGSTQNATASLATVVSGQSYILGCYIDPNDGVTGIATYWLSTVSGSPAAISLLATGTQNLLLASLNPMYLAFGVRTGSASAETLKIDYIQAYGTRQLI